MGAQIDATVTTILGLILAILWAWASLGASTTYNANHITTHYQDPIGKVIPGLFLFIGVFLVQLIRQLFPKFNFFTLQFIIVQTFVLTNNVFATTFDIYSPLIYAFPLFLGAMVSLIVNLFIWPETALDGLGRAFQETLIASHDMLQMISHQFFLDPSTEPVSDDVVDSVAAKMRLGLTKVKGAYREAKYEVSYSYVRPQEVGDIKKSIERFTKHLDILGGCLKSERELFEGALAALERELSETSNNNSDFSDTLSSTNSDSSDSNSSSSSEYSDDDDDDTCDGRHSYANSTLDHEENNSHTPHREQDDSSSDDNMNPHHRHLKKITNRHTFSGLDADLLRAALRSTNEFSQPGGKYKSSSSRHHSPKSGTSRAHSRTTSRTNSRNNSRTNSRANSRRNSLEDEQHFMEENQKSINSIKSFLSLPKKLSNYQHDPLSTKPKKSQSSEKKRKIKKQKKKKNNSSGHHKKKVKYLGAPCVPKKGNKQVDYSDRHLLMIYLQSLRDPLMVLANECSKVLQCSCKRLSIELDVDYHDSTSTTTTKTFVNYFRHLLKLKPKDNNEATNTNTKKEDEIDDKTKTPCQPEIYKCECKNIMHKAIKRFDIAEKKCMDDLYVYKEQRAQAGTLDLGMREELFLVFFFIFTLREAANELEIMSSEMDTLRHHSHLSMVNGKRRKHLYMPTMTYKWWKKWAKRNNHQSTKDKGGQTLSTLLQHMPDGYQANQVIEDEYRLTRLTSARNIKLELSRRQSVSVNSNNNNLSHTTASTSPQITKIPTNTSSVISDISLTQYPNALTQRRRSSITTNPSNDHHYHRPDINETITREKTKKIKHDEEWDLNGPNDRQIKEDHLQKLPFMIRFRYKLWKSLQFTKNYDFKFSLKMAAAVLILSLPAFFPSSASWYQSVRGQWSVMTVMAIMNPTSGGTLAASGWRIVGTFVGALVGWAALEIGGSTPSPYILGLFSILLAIPFYYIHLASTYNKVGTVVLIAYVVVALSPYAFPVDAEETVIWPFVARQAVRKAIPGVLDELADYFTYLMGTFLYHIPTAPPTEEDMKHSMKLENKIQTSIGACIVLLELADNEPRMRGPFPKAFYKAMINGLQDLLNRMIGIRIALFKMSPSTKKHICQHEYYVYRRDMIAAILLHFYTLSSALRSKSPLPIYMPSARAARARLLEHQQKVNNNERFVNFRNLSWFAVSCCTEEIISQLEYLTNLVRFIVGDVKYAQQAKRIDDILNTTT
ncbi:hypothetical protein BJ944DRAFT_254843 [Cunninghamella echinulata]|nr:hypothetical protein BJ944DRAFT_254843 [Cunninghamella echinulata]